MPTISELKSIIRKYKQKSCPAYSGKNMKKADLIKIIKDLKLSDINLDEKKSKKKANDENAPPKIYIKVVKARAKIKNIKKALARAERKEEKSLIKKLNEELNDAVEERNENLRKYNKAIEKEKGNDSESDEEPAKVVKSLKEVEKIVEVLANSVDQKQVVDISTSANKLENALKDDDSDSEDNSEQRRKFLKEYNEGLKNIKNRLREDAEKYVKNQMRNDEEVKKLFLRKNFLNFEKGDDEGAYKAMLFSRLVNNRIEDMPEYLDFRDKKMKEAERYGFDSYFGSGFFGPIAAIIKILPTLYRINYETPLGPGGLIATIKKLTGIDLEPRFLKYIIDMLDKYADNFGEPDKKTPRHR